MERLDFEQRLEIILERWETIEAAIKQAELIQSQVMIPAINELRYAGRHIIRAITSSREMDSRYEKALIIADQYLNNAEHDVVDSVVVFIGSRVDELNLRFGRTSIEKRSPGYGLLNEAIVTCREGIAHSRRDASVRIAIYNKLKQVEIPLLIKLFDELKFSDTVMSAEIEIYDKQITLGRKLIKSQRTVINSLSVSIITLVVAVAVLLVMVLRQ